MSGFFDKLFKHEDKQAKVEPKKPAKAQAKRAGMDTIVDAPRTSKSHYNAKQQKAAPVKAKTTSTKQSGVKAIAEAPEVGASKSSKVKNAKAGSMPSLAYTRVKFFSDKKPAKAATATATQADIDAATAAVQVDLKASIKLDRLEADTQSALEYLIRVVNPTALANSEEKISAKDRLIARFINLHINLAELEPRLPPNPNNKDVEHPGLEILMALNYETKALKILLENREKSSAPTYGEKFRKIGEELTQLESMMDHAQTLVKPNHKRHTFQMA